MILIIDNYDSFTYNLYQYVAEITTSVVSVIRNDQLTIDDIRKNRPTHIILSPGPKTPSEAGICIKLIQNVYTEIPIFGICLGHQAIIEAFGGIVEKTKKVMHGKTSEIVIKKNSLLYEDFPKSFKATRYHSLIGLAESFPKELNIISETEDSIIMGVEHINYPVFGCQYHPESILTEYGKEHFKNFLKI